MDGVGGIYGELVAGATEGPSKCLACIAATPYTDGVPWARERRKAGGDLKGAHCCASLLAALLKGKA